MQRDAATRAAKALGIVVSDAIEFHSGAADFDDIAEQVESFVSDAVLIFAPPGESGQLVHAGAAMGASWFVIGGTELFEPSFIEIATFDSIEQHASVSFTGFSFIEDQAWDYYQKAVTRSSLAERIGYAGNTYAIQYYDLLIATALAIEKAGSTDPAHWAAAMHAVTGARPELDQSSTRIRQSWPIARSCPLSDAPRAFCWRQGPNNRRGTPSAHQSGC